MKTKIKLWVLLILLLSGLLNFNKGFSQCISPVLLPGPPRYEMQTPAGDFFTVTNGIFNCGVPAAGTLTMPGMGLNFNKPTFMLDIMRDATAGTNQDGNIK